jgi:hypothetical protein
MAPSTITSLTDLAELLLTTSEISLAATTAGTPSPSYISPSAPAFDCCPALIVHVQALGEEVTSPLSPFPVTGMRDRYGRIILATFVISALRCAPKMQGDGSVLTTDIEAVAAQVQQDGWALWNGITCAIKNATFQDLCSIVHLDRAMPIREQGNCVGWEFVVRTEIGGIPCVESST